jgi:hypothetical protein
MIIQAIMYILEVSDWMDRRNTCLILLSTVAKILTTNSFFGGSDDMHIFVVVGCIGSQAG